MICIVSLMGETKHVMDPLWSYQSMRGEAEAVDSSLPELQMHFGRKKKDLGSVPQ